MKQNITFEGETTVKKTLFVAVMAMVLVFAFAASAMAASGVPNRSSAYLGTDTSAASKAVSAGGTKAAYVTWAKATADMSAAGVASNLRLTPHGDYATTTIKCQVCHSVHKAVNTGSMLLMNASGGCVVCHGATSAVGSTKKVSADGAASENGGFANEDTRHGKADSCASYECHATSPHGVGVSEYAAAKSAMLSDAVDPMIAAALASGASNAPVDAIINDDWTAEQHFDQMSVSIYQPALDGADAAAITAPADAAALARGRAIVTGYTCANNGCHMNGSFNGVSADATFGNYLITIDGTVFGGSGATTTTAGINNLRTSSIKGHTLFTSASIDTTSAENATAFAASGTCNTCHDQTDVRRADAKAFPHSNAVWRASNAGDPASIQADYGYTKVYSTAAWFKVASDVNAVAVNTNTRNITGATLTDGTTPQMTVGMDGACLKCHKSATNGVGVDF